MISTRTITRHGSRLLIIPLIALASLLGTGHLIAQAAPTTSTRFPLVLSTTAPAPLPAPAGWLSYLNSYRAMASLPALTENTAWSNGDWLHARYMVMNNIIEHTEVSGNPWYTSAGLSAAQTSDLIAGNMGLSDNAVIDSWMSAPFHAIGILDPKLLSVGFGSYRQSTSGFQMGAGLDILDGLGAIPSAAHYPVMWPSQGTSVPLGSYSGGEYPDPLSSCPGYALPSGLPLLLQIGAGTVTPNVTAHSLTQGSTALDHCVFDQTNYSNADAGAQSLGRAVLSSRNAIVLIPRSPLVAGASYTVSITANGQSYTWTFTYSSPA